MAHFHLANIRKLLTEALSDEILRVQVYDIGPFRPIYRKLTATSKKHEVIELVIETAQEAKLLPQILAWVARRNPEIYAKHEPYLIAESDTGEYARPVGNPFSYGNAISTPKRFIGRQREIEQIYSRLHNAEFESSAVVGERRIGKTSLLKHLADPEMIRRAGFPRKHICLSILTYN